MIDAHNTAPQPTSSSDPFTASADTTPFLGAEQEEQTDEMPAILKIIWKAVLLVVGISLILLGLVIIA